MTCSGPVFCRDLNGVCCLLVYDDRRVLVCPQTCVEPTAASRLQSFAYKLLYSQRNLTDYQGSTDTDESMGNLNYNSYINDPYYTNFETYPEASNDYYETDEYHRNSYDEFVEAEEEDKIGKYDDYDDREYYEYPKSEADYPNNYEKYYYTDSNYPNKQNEQHQSISISKQPSVWDFLGKLFKHKQIDKVQNNVISFYYCSLLPL